MRQPSRLAKEWAQPASATTGLQAYNLEGDARPRSGRSRRRTPRVNALDFYRAHGSRRDPYHHIEKGNEMTGANPLVEALDLLKGDVSEILSKAPEDEREAQLHKACEEFAAYVDGLANEVIQEAFTDGRDFAIAKFTENTQGLHKGLSHINGFAILLDNAALMLEPMQKAKWDRPVDADLMAGFQTWVDTGKALVSKLAHDSLNAPDLHKAADETFGGDPATLIARLEKAMGRFGRAADETLNKAFGRPMPRRQDMDDEGDEDGGRGDEGGGYDEGEEMDPVEAIGRLAAGIVTIVDDLMGGGDEEDMRRSADDPKRDPLKKGADGKPEGEAAKSDDRVATLEKHVGELADNMSKIVSFLNNIPAPDKGRPVAVDKASEAALGKGGGGQPTEDQLAKMSERDRALALIKHSQSGAGEIPIAPGFGQPGQAA